MNPRVILAIARKDALDVLRNRTTLMALLTPVFMAALYWVFTLVITGQQTSPQESRAANPAGSGRGGKYDS